MVSVYYSVSIIINTTMHQAALILAIILICAACLWRSKRSISTYRAYSSKLCQTTGILYTPRNDRDKWVLETSKRLVREMMDHLKKQTKSKNAREILGWMNADNVFLYTDPGSGGRVQRRTRARKACLFINPDKVDNHNEARLQSKICHEMAHLTGRGHDRKWRDTTKYLLNLTSRDLGWKNALECGSCIKYNICNKKMCPRCAWLQGDHTKCRPLEKRGSLLN